MTKFMQRAGLVLALLLGGLWLARSLSAGPDLPTALAPPGRPSGGHSPAGGKLPLVDAARAAVSGVQAAPALPAPQPEPEAVPAEDPPSEAEFVVLVLDPDENPVPGASVQLTGMRPAASIGSHWRLRETPAPVITDHQGRARLQHPTRIGSDDIGAISLSVQHPGFVPYSDSSVPVRPPTAEVHLVRGSLLVVTGWIGDPSNVITEVDPLLPRSGLDPDSWTRLGDGRRCNERVPAGSHALSLTHRDAQGVTWRSHLEEFTIATSEQKELHIELLPSLVLAGRLSDEVPRPVTDGVVRINLFKGGARPGAVNVSRFFDAPIARDGSFRFEDLPPGDLQLFAQCEGWVVRREATRDLDHLSLNVLEEPKWNIQHEACLAAGLPTEDSYEEYCQERIDDYLSHSPDAAYVLPWFRFESDTTERVIPMNATVALSVTVLDEFDEPLSGVNIGVTPNIHWSAVNSSQSFPHCPERRVTGADGRTVLRGLPARLLTLTATREGYELREQDARGPRLKVAAGPDAWSERTIHMAAKGD